jgi:hypothetical protein
MRNSSASRWKCRAWQALEAQGGKMEKTVASRTLVCAVLPGLILAGGSLSEPQSGRAQPAAPTPQITEIAPPLETEITRSLGDPYRYDFELPASANGFVAVPRDWMTDMDPKIAPQNADDKTLSTFATPGETEPLSFAIYATDSLQDVTVSASDLKSGGSIIPTNQITLRTVMRTPERIGYWMSSDPKNYVITNRFLPAFAPFDLQAHQFREIWISIQVPANAAPGDYQGQATISAQGKPATTLTLKLGVLPFTLQDDPAKQYGVYFRSLLKPENHDRTIAELKDIKAHENSLVFWSRAVTYQKNAAGEISWSFDEVEKQMAWLEEAGFSNTPIFLNSGFVKLAALMGHKGDNATLAAEIEKDEKFAAIARAMLLDLKAFSAKHPQHEIVIVHLDEVFGNGKLPLQIALAKATRQVPGFRQYATFHTVNEEANALRAEFDPYVDVRNNHGYSFEWWLTRGHTIDEYKKELKASGDIAYFYQNIRTVYNNAEWQRITNGLYMWINPFSARIDWIYYWPFEPKDEHKTSGNPLTLDAEGGHWWGFVAPAATENGTPMPTRNWEAWREGIDDLRYLYTLEKLIQTYQVEDRQDESQAAENWMRDLKAKIPKAQGIEVGATGTPEGEGPLINAIDKAFMPEDYQQMRAQAAKFIIELQKNLKR